MYSNEKNGLQQFQMESCQQIKRLKDKKKKKKKKNKEEVGEEVYITDYRVWTETVKY